MYLHDSVLLNSQKFVVKNIVLGCQLINSKAHKLDGDKIGVSPLQQEDEFPPPEIAIICAF